MVLGYLEFIAIGLVLKVCQHVITGVYEMNHDGVSKDAWKKAIAYQNKPYTFYWNQSDQILVLANEQRS